MTYDVGILSYLVYNWRKKNLRNIKFLAHEYSSKAGFIQPDEFYDWNLDISDRNKNQAEMNLKSP